jgi:hypothetical protein
VDPDVNVVDDYVSSYALGDYGWLSRLADLSMAMGVVTIALGLRARLPAGRRVATTWALMLAAGVGFVGSAIFDTDPIGTVEASARGALHDLSGYVSLLGLLVAAWLLVGVLKRATSDRWRPQRRFAILISVTMVVLMTAEPIVGLSQRMFILVVATWLLYLAVRLRSATLVNVEGAGPTSVA